MSLKHPVNLFYRDQNEGEPGANESGMRLEADNFRSVTFKNLLRFLDAVGLEVTIKETRMTRTNKNNSRKKHSK